MHVIDQVRDDERHGAAAWWHSRGRYNLRQIKNRAISKRKLVDSIL
jgi:hypothetical protein